MKSMMEWKWMGNIGQEPVFQRIINDQLWEISPLDDKYVVYSNKVISARGFENSYNAITFVNDSFER